MTNLGTKTQVSNEGSVTIPESLTEWEQLLKDHSADSKVGLCILDAHFRYFAMNQTLAHINGIPADTCKGKTVREQLGNFADLVEPYYKQVRDTGIAVLNRELNARLPTRRELGHWIDHYIPIKDSMGRVTHIGVVVVEITEQKRIEDSFRRLSKNLKDQRTRSQIVAEVGRLLESRWDIQQIFPMISAYLRRVLRQEYAALCLSDPESGRLIRQATDFPLRKNGRHCGPVSTANDPGARAFQEQASLILNKDVMRTFDSDLTHHLFAEGLQSFCCVPLIRAKAAVGVLELGSTRADAFGTEDLMLLKQVAAQLALAFENASITSEVKLLRSQLSREKRYLQGESSPAIHPQGIIGRSPALRQILAQVAVVAESNATVLLLGETGTGKGLIARALHNASLRKERAFVTLNCAAIPTGLLESELFGHEKGAFTGAVQRKVGRLELADKGTLFLDEIGEISLDLQPKLLRVLQDHEFERLGGIRTINVDMRLIAATNRDLAKSVVEKEFRSDLFYRLNVFPIRLPPLRERREDIPLLVRVFVNRFASRMGKVIETIPRETMDALMNWDWVGNVRELENFIERSIILTEGTALRAPVDDLQRQTPDEIRKSLKNSEREHILDVLRDCGGVIAGQNGAARRLGVKRTTLQSKMKKLGIIPQEYCPPQN